MRISYGTIPALAAMALLSTAFAAQQAAPGDDAAPQATAPFHANSKVRIVRLSEVKGEVQLDRSTGQGFEPAMANIPIIENAQLQTSTGAAEVEFEDNSTLRLGPDSLVKFPQLEMQPSGVKVSTIAVEKGMVYLSRLNTKDEFTIAFGQEKVYLEPASHIRLEVEPTEAKLAVFEGSAKVEGPSGAVEAAKKKTLVFNLADPNAPVVAKNVSSDPFDSWDHDSADYHKRYVAQSALASTPYSYGVSDMMYYGSFINGGSCGMMWQPYFASAGWDPFANGAWAYYPGAGYSWVSPYPWGWTPYHYGNWVSCPGMGWGWQPGGSWYGLGNQPTALGSGGLPVHPVQPPSRAPIGRAIVLVNSQPLTRSAYGSSDTFVFRKDSAGFGVPRGSLGKLDGLSRDAVHHGSSFIPVYSPYSSWYSQPGSRGAQATIVQGPRPGMSPYHPAGAQAATPTGTMAPSGMQPGYSSTAMGPASSGARMGTGTSGASSGARAGSGSPK